MTVNAYPADSATQRATWHSEQNPGYWAAVTLSSERQDNKRGWAWDLCYPSQYPDVWSHYSETRPAHMIYAPEGLSDTSTDVLETLASFLSAWEEAQRYPNSDNRDLFEQRHEPFLAVVEEMSCDLMYVTEPLEG